MSIPLGGTVTSTCQDIRQGTIFRLFDLKCTNVLQKVPPTINPHLRRLPKNSAKTTYITFERDLGLEVCDKENFARRNYVFRMSARLKTKCPWYQCQSVGIRISMVYSEATSPTNTVTSPLTTRDFTWSKDTIMDQTFNTDSIGDPFGFGSTGEGEARFQLEQIDSDPTNPCVDSSVRLTATLTRLGIPYDYLVGTSVQHVSGLSCGGFVQNSGTSFDSFWTGVGFPRGPIGLVMSLSYNVAWIPDSHLGCE